MAQYFRDAQGTMHEFPDDATPEEIDSATRDLDKPRAAQPQKPAAPKRFEGNTYNLTGTPGVSTQIGGMLDSIQHHALSPIHGLAQWAGSAILPASTVASDKAALEQRESDYQARTAGNAGASIGAPIGAAIPFLAAGPARLLQGAGTSVAAALPRAAPQLLQRGANLATQGSILGASQPVMGDDSRLANAGYGAALNLAGGTLADGLMASGTKAAKAMEPHVRELWKAAKARGIELTPAQLSDSRFLRFMQSQMGILPGSGAAAKTAAQRTQFNRAAAKAIGEDADAVTPEVYGRAKSRQSAQFDELTGRNSLRIDLPLMQRLETIVQEADVVGGEVATTTRNFVDNILGRATTSPAGVVVPGRAYQAFDTQAGQVTKMGTPASHYVGQVKEAVRDAMDSSISPADRAAWNQLRKEYGNRKTLRDLVTDNGIAPTGLMARVRSNNAGKEAMASGTRGEMGELAKIGQRMKEPPSSGTAERTLINSAWNPLQWPGLALGALAGPVVGRAANSSALLELMMREGRGNTRKLLSNAARPAAPALLPYLPRSASASEGKDKKK